MNSMVDRPKAVIAGAGVTVAVLFLLGVGFAAGRATSDDSTNTETPGGAGSSTSPTGTSESVPVGFGHSESGARNAALAWFPWLYSSPISEQPEGLDQVVADGVDIPGEGLSERFASVRFQFAPVAVKVEMESDDRVRVTFLGPVLRAAQGDELSGEILALPVTLEWDEAADDWRISDLPTGTFADYDVGDTLDVADVEGFEAIRPTSVIPGSLIVEEVPGD